MQINFNMLSLNKSFIMGIIFASITWLISLYLYMQLTNTQTTQLVSSSDIKLKINDTYKNKVYTIAKNSETYKRQNYKKYFNSEKLIKSLQPVTPKSNAQIDKDLSELGMITTLEDKRIRDEGYKLYAFNALVSQKMSFARKIPDTRNKLCVNKTYNSKLPDTSVIICFYNEHFYTLIRSITSILNRTPLNLIREIIVVDDFSDIDGLSANVSNYIEHTSNKVKFLKTQRREGLIRARMFGANHATGEVIVFLDSHIEVNVDWLQPLLNRIVDSPKTVAIPIIDIINPDTFAYSASPLVRGGFNWGLHFKWENLPTGTLTKDEDFIKPIKSPTMAGGLFAMNRRYFINLGEYDPGMNIWGGENIELSFRVWMCGGDLELIPCSRVGHVFRKRRPYGSPNGEDTMLRNSLRVAHIWLDEYKEHFYKQRPESRNISFGDISQRLLLKEHLQCKNFDWYLKNVYPELVLPTDDEQRLKKKWNALEQQKFQPWNARKRNYVAQYQIRLSNSSYCIQSAQDEKTKGSSLELGSCLRAKKQIWYETDRSELVLAQLLCMDVRQEKVRLSKCHEMGGSQEWKHKGENGTPIYNIASGTCLSVKKKRIGAAIIMELCNHPDLNQWDLIL